MDATKKIRLTSDDMSVVVLGNFNVIEDEIDPNFYFPGTWYDFWTGDSIIVTNVNEPILLKEGEYRLYTSKKLVTPEFVGVNAKVYSNEFLKLNIYPNPATSQLNIFVDHQTGGKADIEIFDIHGKIVKILGVFQIDNGSNRIQSNISEIDAGIYFVKIEIEGKMLIEKLIIR